MTDRNRFISITVVAVLVLAGLGWWLLAGPDPLVEPEPAAGEPVDIALDFYEPWLAAVKATSTDPYQEELAESLILGKELRTRLAGEKPSEGEPDPVLCQTAVAPDTNLSARSVLENEDRAQVLVMSARPSAPGQATVTLLKQSGGWYIADIECTSGESGPKREFSFTEEGFLLKEVPEPLDSRYWHLVFEQDGQGGHTVPLFFDEESQCEGPDQAVSRCDPEELTQTSKVQVKGEMIESGVEVQHLKVVE